MQVTRFDFNEAAYQQFIHDPAGNLGEILFGIGEKIAVAAQETVGVQFPGNVLNPPPGPPYRRSGDMQASIRATPPHVTQLGLTVDVVAPAAHRGFAYPQWLLFQGYRFVSDSYLNSLA